jgi:C4-dicarboxylate transporter, DctM subunit
MITAMVVIFLVLLITNVPILFAIGLSTLVAIYFFSNLPLLYIPQIMFPTVDSFELLAVPFFILSGAIMKGGGISRRLVEFINSIVGSYTGGLAIVAIVSCELFGAISGSAAATTAAIGGVMIPYMVEKGYDRGFSAALVSCSGGIGIMIPPSIPAVLYCVLAGTSVASVFAAGIGPGIVFGFAYIIVSYIHAKRKGYERTRRASFIEILKTGKNAAWALFMPVLILGGIYSGLFTPTEAAAVSVIYAFFVGFFIYKEINLRDLKNVLLESAEMSAMVMILIAVSSVFSALLTQQNVPNLLAEWIKSADLGSFWFLLLVNGVLVLIGCFMSPIPALIILTPLLVPLLGDLGVNPVHFGQIFNVNVAIGALTPPFGVDMFVACAITKIPIDEYARKGVFLIIASFVSLLVVTFIPEICLFIPRLLGMKLGI